ncbi:ABC transporter permease [Zafaria sp. Z1313]|uniref:ABC transporter permease n=1 Tax=unclassified Zafaria TaxID=2828765 RepID=UPI002E77842A|nr:ABC transporter permease [Zafaria sp. J156]MEE1621612.1 ABC transporter permease [Zafaria sp. J156]
MSVATLTSDSAAMVHRSVLHTVRNVEALLMAVILPVMMLLLFTAIFGGALDPSGRYIDYIVPGTIILSAAFGASMTAMSVAKDMNEGIVDRFRTMNMAASAVLTGHVVASVVRNMVSTALVFGVGLAIGFRPTASAGQWLAAVGMLAAFMFAMSWVMAVLGLLAKSVDAANGFSFIVVFLPYISSAFVPIETMPAWLRPIAEHQPVTPVIESVRAWLFSMDPGGHPAAALMWCAGLTLVSVAGCVLLWRRATRR